MKIFNRTADGWHGCLVLTQSSDTKGALVEVTFDDFVTAFVVNFNQFNLIILEKQFIF